MACARYSLRHRTHLTGDHLPTVASLARPHANIPERPARDGALDFHGETRPKRRHGDVRAHATHTELLRHVLTEPHGTGAMRGEVVTLGRKPAVRAREQKIVGNQCVERRDVRVELRSPESSLELDHLRVWTSDEAHIGDVASLDRLDELVARSHV